ncbi:MAG: APC family permease [Nitrospinae bacterium]|nr:APC family permease [Nitrospinota bacterium]
MEPPQKNGGFRADKNNRSGPAGFSRLKNFLIGPPRDLNDRSLYRRLSLISFLAWVGLGADGLSSSAYGPEEAFRQLGAHTYLAFGLAAMTALTVFVISYAYSRVIEHFPHGGGGYAVASKLLGPRAGMVSGSALIVDYALTITISIAAAGDAMFSLAPLLAEWKLPAEILMIAFLTVINLRGVRESALTLAPVFMLFVITHLILIAGGVLIKGPELPDTVSMAGEGFSAGIAALGFGGVAALFLHAYSMGGGTYTGIEAVSNGLSVMREPRVQTGKRTMVYMAVSLAFTASGLLLCYMLWGIAPVEGKTMNAALTEKFAANIPYGNVFVLLTMVSEAAILAVAAQSGFADGPRVMANMSVDSWIPHRFATLSERLTTQNGILLMGAASLAALFYTRGNVGLIVVMYSINVFLTFSMTELSMCLHWIHNRNSDSLWRRKITIHIIGLALCLTILAITVYEKFFEGGWITLVVTGIVVLLCLLIRGHYSLIGGKLVNLYNSLMETPLMGGGPQEAPDASKRTAIILVSGYGGLGLHTFLNVFKEFPGHFEGVVFVSVAVIDWREFKGELMVERLKGKVEADLKKYVWFSRGQGIPATYRFTVGTDTVDEAEKLCLQLAGEYPHSTIFAGKIIFEKERWYHRLLHNETAFAIQKRLQWAGKTVVVAPARVM